MRAVATVVVVVDVARLAFGFVRVLPLVHKGDAERAIEESHLAHALGERGVVEVEVVEDQRVGFEMGGGAVLAGLAELLHVGDRHPPLEALPEAIAVAADFDGQPLGESVDHAHTDPVQAPGDLVALAPELAARV